jgi:hypothetical protein
MNQVGKEQPLPLPCVILIHKKSNLGYYWHRSITVLVLVLGGAEAEAHGEIRVSLTA